MQAAPPDREANGGASAPDLGVYAGPGGLDAAEAFASSVHLPVGYALDFIGDSSWQSISSPSWTLAQWHGTRLTMIFGVPMLPASGATLAQGAAGDYDGEFVTLAQQLVAKGFGDALLMVGYDPSISGSPWSAGTPALASSYVAYWQRIVTAMRSVPGQSFRFVWDCTPSAGLVTAPQLYPGNSWVDVVATDAFDETFGQPASRWSYLLNKPYGLQWFADFADTMDKPLLIAKWGLVPASVPGGGGDDSTLVSSLLSWAERQDVLAAVVWDDGSWAVESPAFPNAARVLQDAGTKGRSTNAPGTPASYRAVEPGDRRLHRTESGN